MSFAQDKAGLSGVVGAQSLRDFERDALAPSLPPSVDPDTAVEMLSDQITRSDCNFRFKQPLGNEFEVARDAALNCLDDTVEAIPPRKIDDWIRNCLQCMDVVLLVYVRDIRRVSVPNTSGRPRERDVYNAIEGLAEGVAIVGTNFHSIYEHRSSLLHRQKLMKDGSGNRFIKKIGNKEKRKILFYSRDKMSESLVILIPEYKSAFPAFVTGVTQGSSIVDTSQP